jgi:hypothetical protein
MEPRNRFHVIVSASLCSLACRYDNPIPTQFLVLALIECLKISGQMWGGRGVAGSQPMSTEVHRSPNKLRWSNSIFNIWVKGRKILKIMGSLKHSQNKTFSHAFGKYRYIDISFWERCQRSLASYLLRDMQLSLRRMPFTEHKVS